MPWLALGCERQVVWEGGVEAQEERSQLLPVTQDPHFSLELDLLLDGQRQ